MDAKEAMIKDYRKLLSLLEQEEEQCERSFQGKIQRVYGEVLRAEAYKIHKSLQRLYAV